MASRRRPYSVPLVAGVLLVSASQVSAFVAGIAPQGGSCFRTRPAPGGGASRAANGARGYDEGVGRRVLAGRRVQRCAARLAATSEGEDDADASDKEDGDTSGNDGEDAVWARAELPLSNDVQVEQATRAVWQVTDLPPASSNPARCFEIVVELNFLSSYAGLEKTQ